MKKLCALLLLFYFTSLPQSTYFNLKGITSLNVSVSDQSNVLSDETLQKLIVESKLKLMSAGIDIKDNSALFIISINKISKDQIAVWIRIQESASLIRDKKKILSEVISYSDLKFVEWFYSSKIVYYEIMNVQLLKFIDSFLEANK